jgi:hypothetical protein
MPFIQSLVLYKDTEFGQTANNLCNALFLLNLVYMRVESLFALAAVDRFGVYKVETVGGTVELSQWALSLACICMHDIG